MRFVDLNTLKITKGYNFKTKATEIDLTQAETIFDIKEKARQALSYFFEPCAIECNYEIIIQRDVEEDAEEFFLTAVNVISAIFFDVITTSKGRKRERRLDVPEQLKVLKTNMSLLKRAINAQTQCDVFNLTITWPQKDGSVLTYGLVSQSKEDE